LEPLKFIYLRQEETGYDSDSTAEAKEADGRETERLWPVQLLLEPLTKRFRFHFTEKKATNRIDKVPFPLYIFFMMS